MVGEWNHVGGGKRGGKRGKPSQVMFALEHLKLMDQSEHVSVVIADENNNKKEPEFETVANIPARIERVKKDGTGQLTLHLDKSVDQHQKALHIFEESGINSTLEFEMRKHNASWISGLSRTLLSKSDEVICSVQVCEERKNVELKEFVVRRSRDEEEMFHSIKSDLDLNGSTKLTNYLTCEAEVQSIPKGKSYCFVTVDTSKFDQSCFKSKLCKLELRNLFSLGNQLIEGDVLTAFFDPQTVQLYRNNPNFNPPVSKAFLKKFNFDEKGRKPTSINFIALETVTFFAKTKSDQQSEGMSTIAQHFAVDSPTKAIVTVLLRYATFAGVRVENILRAILVLLDFAEAHLGDTTTKELLSFMAANKFFTHDSLLSRFLGSYDNSSVIPAGRLLNILSLLNRLLPEYSEKCEQLMAQNAKFENVYKTRHLYGISSGQTNPNSDLSLAPTAVELQLFIENESELLLNLKPVRIQGPYSSLDEYLQTYFQLLRHDCFYLIMKGIRNLVQGHREERDMNLATDGTVAGLHLDTGSDSKTFSVTAKIHMKPYVSEHSLESRYFLRGNLVAVSATNFAEDVVWGAVQRRSDEFANGSITVVVEYIDVPNTTFAKDLQTLVSRNGSLVIVEAPTMFASYQPVLKSMQDLTSANFAFRNELILAQALPFRFSAHAGATFSLNKLYTDGDTAINVDNFFHEAEHSSNCILDGSQFEAMKHMLKTRVSIVQGPPGTGKTYLGVHLTNVLLDLKLSEKADFRTGPAVTSPILVLTYKNHALDEFSRAILRTNFLQTPGCFLRLGGQSKDNTMAQYSLKNVLGKPSEFELRICHEIDDLNLKINAAFKKFRKIVESPLEVDVLLKCFDSLQLANMLRDKISDYDLQTHLKAYSCIELMGEAIFDHLNTRKFYSAINYLVEKVVESLDQWLPSDTFTLSSQRELQHLETEIKQLSSKRDKSRFLYSNSTTDNDTDEQDLELALETEKLIEERFEAAGLKNDFTTQTIVQESDLVGPKFDPYGSSHGSPKCMEFLGYATEILAKRTDFWSLRKVKDIWTLQEANRLHLVQYLVWKQRERALNEMDELFEQLHVKIEQRTKMRLQREAAAVKKARVIAMTTTGAAMRADLLNVVQPQVIIVEEAAEINEAQLIALLGNHVKHLVMIGDHKQLRPNVECYDLVHKFHFDISMMERLINNDIEFSTLETQNRMRPDISMYLTDIYPKLRDHPRVSLNPSVRGLATNCFFWDHDYLETGGRSYCNRVEAKAVVELVSYLINANCYNPKSVTVLAGYQGQTGELRRLMRSDPRLTGKWIDVQTIDNFQGDENDIVIVSLVRSNTNATSGFIGVLNRRCVAQSRGKSGVIFLGNAATLERQKRSCEVWTPLLNRLRQEGCFGKKLILNCSKHLDVKKGVVVGGEPFASTNFCFVPCGTQMDCGLHICGLPCQPFHYDHKICYEQVEIVHPCGHNGVKKCYEEPRVVKCTAPVEFTHICGVHNGTKKCYQEAHEVKCNAPCEYVYHSTGTGNATSTSDSALKANMESAESIEHRCKRQCGDKHVHVVCTERVKVWCDAELHQIETNCFEKDSPQKCKEKVPFIYACGKHQGIKLCHQDYTNIVCIEQCSATLKPCGHPCPKECDPPHSHNSQITECSFQVEYICPDCGQLGSKLCYQKAALVQCWNTVEFKLRCGRHFGQAECFKDKLNIPCRFTCGQKLYPCGDACQKPCSSKHSHDNQNCEALKHFEHRCGNRLKRKCYQKESDIVCKYDCSQELKCGHTCSESCEPAHRHDKIRCRVQIDDKCLECGKGLKRECWKSIKDVKCDKTVKYERPGCGHAALVECYKNTDFKRPECDKVCGKKLDRCHHLCRKKCGEEHDHNDSRACDQIVEILHHCGTVLRVPCYDEGKKSYDCPGKCSSKLPCGHQCVRKCGTNHDHVYECQQNVNFKCRKCDSKLQRKCRESEHEVTCSANVKHKCKKCNRLSELKCNVGKDKFQCELGCDKILPCQHKCGKMCYEECDESKCGKCEEAKRRGIKGRERSRSRSKSCSRITVDTSDLAEKRQKIELIQAQIEQLPSSRLSRFSISDIDIDNASFLHESDLQIVSVMKGQALNFVSLYKNLVARVSKVSIVNYVAAKRAFLEKQKEIRDPRNVETLCYYSQEASREPISFCEFGFHRKAQNGAGLPIKFPQNSVKIGETCHGQILNVLICDVLIGRCNVVYNSSAPSNNNSIKGRFDSIRQDTKDSEDVIRSTYCIYDPYYIYVTGYVSLLLEPLNELLEAIDEEILASGNPTCSLNLDPTNEINFSYFEQQLYDIGLQVLISAGQKSGLEVVIKGAIISISTKVLRSYKEKLDRLNNANERLLIRVGSLIQKGINLLQFSDRIPRASEELGVKEQQVTVWRVPIGACVDQSECSNFKSGKRCTVHDSHEDKQKRMFTIQNSTSGQTIPLITFRCLFE